MKHDDGIAAIKGTMKQLLLHVERTQVGHVQQPWSTILQQVQGKVTSTQPNQAHQANDYLGISCSVAYGSYCKRRPKSSLEAGWRHMSA
jgi:hypothetical protein